MIIYGIPRTRPIQPSIYRVNILGCFNPTPIRGLLNPSLIDRVNIIMTKDLHKIVIPFGQVHQTISYIGLINGDILTLHPNIGLIWCYFDPTSKWG